MLCNPHCLIEGIKGSTLIHKKKILSGTKLQKKILQIHLHRDFELYMEQYLQQSLDNFSVNFYRSYFLKQLDENIFSQQYILYSVHEEDLN